MASIFAFIGGSTFLSIVVLGLTIYGGIKLYNLIAKSITTTTKRK